MIIHILIKNLLRHKHVTGMLFYKTVKLGQQVF